MDKEDCARILSLTAPELQQELKDGKIKAIQVLHAYQGNVSRLCHVVFYTRAPDKIVKLTFRDIACIISSPSPVFDHLLKSSHRDDFIKWLNIGLGEEIGIIEIKYAPFLKHWFTFIFIPLYSIQCTRCPPKKITLNFNLA